MDALPLRLAKADAVLELGRRAGVATPSGQGSGVPATLEIIGSLLPPLRNFEVDVRQAEHLGLRWISFQHANAHPLEPPLHMNGRPGCFDNNHTAFSPDFRVLQINNGFIGECFGATLITTQDARCVVHDVSSYYTPLFRYYDFDFGSVFDDAPFVDGTVIPIMDDIRPLNYCHWLLDWLPRLAFLGQRSYRSAIYVVTTPLIAKFQRDSLRMCGFDDSRIIALDSFQAVRARELLVPSNLRELHHPIQKAAPWAMSYLRSTVGMQSLIAAGAGAREQQKIYVSRADATRRRVVNDAELAAMLSQFGYRAITLSDLSLAEQAATFAHASHVVSLHGAGLSNLVFTTPGANVIEIFPERYGTPAFWVLAAGMECPYATYVADRTFCNRNLQSDDVEVDLGQFREACVPLL